MNIFATITLNIWKSGSKLCFIQLQDNEGKENGVETDERKDDITYADLDKSAMTSGVLIKRMSIVQEMILVYN